MTARAKLGNKWTIGHVPELSEWELVCEDQNERDICYTVIARIRGPLLELIISH
jgi:hypothetical protein